MMNFNSLDSLEWQSEAGTFKSYFRSKKLRVFSSLIEVVLISKFQTCEGFLFNKLFILFPSFHFLNFFWLFNNEILRISGRNFLERIFFFCINYRFGCSNALPLWWNINKNLYCHRHWLPSVIATHCSNILYGKRKVENVGNATTLETIFGINFVSFLLQGLICRVIMVWSCFWRRMIWNDCMILRRSALKDTLENRKLYLTNQRMKGLRQRMIGSKIWHKRLRTSIRRKIFNRQPFRYN